MTSAYDYRPRLWRIATATRPALQVSHEPAPRPGRWHAAGDRVLHAYESEELAALSLSHMTQGVDAPRLVHEAILLPENPRLHAEFHVESDAQASRAYRASAAVGLPIVNLVTLMQERRLLSLWITTPYATNQRTVLLNVLHPAFAEVEIHSNLMDGSSFFSTGPCGAKATASWARTEAQKPAQRRALSAASFAY